MSPEELCKLLTVSKKIGEGANGLVFKCIIKSKIVAIKLVIWSNYEKEKQLYNIYQNLNMSCKKYLPKPVDLKITKIKYNNRFRGIIAYEFIEGVAFRDYIKIKNNHVNIPIIMKNIQKGLFCLWKNGYIHGDLHLDNIMILPNFNVQLIDFSTSKQVSKLIYKNKKHTIKWFEKQWNKFFILNVHNPNIALYNWEKLNSKGIWNHEKTIIQKQMKISSLKF